jgi:hypothetical protein
MNDDDVLVPGAVSALAAAFSSAPDVIAGNRLAALRILFSRTYPRQQTLLNTVYSLAVIASPDVARALRRLTSKAGSRRQNLPYEGPSPGCQNRGPPGRPPRDRPIV